jgi:hypothetical protein
MSVSSIIKQVYPYYSLKLSLGWVLPSLNFYNYLPSSFKWKIIELLIYNSLNWAIVEKWSILLILSIDIVLTCGIFFSK